MEQQHVAAGQEQWEYHIEFIQTRTVSGVLTPMHQAQLNQFGADGWELVAAIQGYYSTQSDMHGQQGAQGVSLVFKRRLRGGQELTSGERSS